MLTLKRTLGILLMLLFGVACASGAQPVAGAERDAVITYAEPLTDNLMAGFNNGDYATFARDFDDPMKKAMDQSAFNSTRATLMDKIGAYVSRQVSAVQKQDAFVIVLYSAKFEKDDNVTMRVVFEQAGAHPVAGLWFDSPKLR